jgi:hypothetical protein
VLDQPPDKLLLRAITGVFHADRDDRVAVDMSTLARTSDPRLQRLRRWATVRARQRPEGQAVEELDEHALAALTKLAGTTRHHLV